MSRGRERCWLERGDGTRLRVGVEGVLIGRNTDCDVVLQDPRASRHHALVRIGASGPELLPMGKTPIQVNGAPVNAPTSLSPSDEISAYELRLRVSIETETTEDGTAAGWVLQRGQKGLYGVTQSPFSVGGDPDDDLVIDKLPGSSLRFLIAQGALFVEAGADASVSEREISEGDVEPVASGDVISLAGETLQVIALTEASQRSTVVSSETPLPAAAKLQFLPRGGRLFLRFDEQEVSTYLSDRRCDLVAALLQPPSPYAQGEFIPDDVLCPMIWPNKPEMGRTDMNTLVFRLRKDLVKADINGVKLVERAPGGGGTRINLIRGATVSVD